VKWKMANGVGSQYSSHTTSEYGVSGITTADAHTSAASSRTDALTERRNLVSARVLSRLHWPLLCSDHSMFPSTVSLSCTECSEN